MVPSSMSLPMSSSMPSRAKTKRRGVSTKVNDALEHVGSRGWPDDVSSFGLPSTVTTVHCAVVCTRAIPTSFLARRGVVHLGGVAVGSPTRWRLIVDSDGSARDVGACAHANLARFVRPHDAARHGRITLVSLALALALALAPLRRGVFPRLMSSEAVCATRRGTSSVASGSPSVRHARVARCLGWAQFEDRVPVELRLFCLGAQGPRCRPVQGPASASGSVPTARRVVGRQPAAEPGGVPGGQRVSSGQHASTMG